MACKHRWEEVSRRFNEPNPYIKLLKGDPDYVQKMTYGFTNITQRCGNCYKVVVESCHGQVN